METFISNQLNSFFSMKKRNIVKEYQPLNNYIRIDYAYIIKDAEEHVIGGIYSNTCYLELLGEYIDIDLSKILIYDVNLNNEFITYKIIRIEYYK